MNYNKENNEFSYNNLLEWTSIVVEWCCEIFLHLCVQLESEIATLKSVLDAKVRQANDLKQRLGMTHIAELKRDFEHGVQTLRSSESLVYSHFLQQANGNQTLWWTIPYLCDILQHHEPTWSLHSSSSHELSVRRHYLTFGSRAFSVLLESLEFITCQYSWN